jgi:hypothetical protein
MNVINYLQEKQKNFVQKSKLNKKKILFNTFIRLTITYLLDHLNYS